MHVASRPGPSPLTPPRLTPPRLLLALVPLVPLALACNPKPAPRQPEPVGSPAQVQVESDPGDCNTLICLRDRAQAATAAGVRDRAAHYLGQAYRRSPSDGSFDLWTQALLAAGQRRALALALAEAKAAGLHATVLAGLGPIDAPPDAAILPELGSSTGSLRAAYQADAEGRLAEAIAGLADAVEPLDLARRGDLAWAAGDRKAAREAWSAARAAIDDRGGSMRLIPAERWFVESLFWSGDELTMVHGWRPLGYEQDFKAVELRRWAIGDDGESAQLRRSLLLPEPLTGLAPSPDGRTLYGISARGLELVDAVDGRRLRTLAVADINHYAIISEGVEGHALLAIHHADEPAAVELWTLAGERLDRWTLDGTTPTIIRAYTGEGSYHRNILRESPTWPTTLTFSDDLRWVAIGGSDSKVRLIDRKRGKQRLLEYDWTYEERRHRGGNPDLNLPLALRFYEDENNELLVAYSHGDLLRWRPSDGKLLAHHPGACSIAEARLTVNRYAQPGSVAQPSDDDREACGRAERIRLSADGRLLASFGDGARVRDTKTGKSVALWTDWHSIGAMADFAGDGRMAFANIYGRPWLWSGRVGEALTRPLGAEEPQTGPLAPELGVDDAQLSWVEDGERWISWDLIHGRETSPSMLPDERIRAISADGRRVIVGLGDRLEVRERQRGVEYSHAGTSTQAQLLGNDGHLALFSDYQGAKTLVNLDDGGRGVELDLPDEEAINLAAGDEQGERLLWLTPREALLLYDGRSGALLRSWTDTRARAIALAPDGSWLAWLEQAVVDEGEPAESVVHLVPLVPGSEQTVTMPGWAKLLAAAPDSRELLAFTESAVVRIRPSGSSQRIDLGYVFANEVRYGADGRWLAFATYNRVDIRANTAALPRVASVFPLFEGGWVAMSPGGAVEGNVDAHAQLVTLVTDAEGRRLTFSGGLGWDRFEAPGLVRAALRGQPVEPSMPATPLPAVETDEADP